MRACRTCPTDDQARLSNRMAYASFFPSSPGSIGRPSSRVKVITAGLTPPVLAPQLYGQAGPMGSSLPFGVAQQLQAQQSFLNQALMAGRVSPQRYQQLMGQLSQRQNLLQQQ